MILVPITLRKANDFVCTFHRHNGKVQGGKFAIGAEDNEEIIGVAIVGRTIARLLHDRFTAEVTRVCILPNAPKGTNSFLYAACWRAWRGMGGRKLITYTLKSESGASLRGAGWKVIAETVAAPNGWGRNGRARKYQQIYGQEKLRWEVTA